MATIDIDKELAGLGLDVGMDAGLDNLAADLAADNFKRLFKFELGTTQLRIFPAVVPLEGGEPSWYVKGKVHFFQRGDGRTVPVPCAMDYAAQQGEQADCWGCRQVAAMFRAGNEDDAKRSKPKTQYYCVAIVRGEQEKLGLQVVPLSRMAMTVVNKAIKAFLDDPDTAPDEKQVFHPIFGRDIRIEKSNDDNNPWTCVVGRRSTPMLPTLVRLGPDKRPLPFTPESKTEFIDAFKALVQARHELDLPSVVVPMPEPEIIRMMQGDGAGGSSQTRPALPAATGPRNIEAQLRGANSRTQAPVEADEYYGDDETETGDEDIPF